MSDPAVMHALPGLLRAARTSVEEHAPIYAPTVSLRWTLLMLLEAATFAAERFVKLTPLPPAPTPVADTEPRVPRRVGARLPDGRYHP